MKIAFISAARSIHTVKWVNFLARRGHEIRLYSLPDHENKLGNIDPAVNIVYLEKSGFAGYFTNAPQLRRQIRDFAPDIVNAHYASGYGTLAALSRVHPLLLSVWGSDVYDFPLKSPVHKQLVKRNLEKADAVASTSRVMADRVRRVLRYNKPIFITPFGVDTSLFCPGEEPGGQRAGVRFGTVKALEDKYGMDYLIRAFAMVKKRLPDSADVTLEIYGKGSRREALQGLIDSLGLSDCAKLCGAVPNTQVPEIIRGMDIFCLPSTLDSESFGVSAVEAMACGVPVVCSDVDGFRETVEDGVTGYLVPRCNEKALADKMYELAVNPQLCRMLGKAGRERVLRLYDFSKNVEEMEDFYRRTIELAHRSGR